MHYEERFGGKEFKFLLAPPMAQQVQTWADAHLEADPHGSAYRVTSLYFDTPAFDVFHQRGSYARAKYRVRRYDDAETVFLERKLKAESVVTKRRSIIGLDEVPLIGGTAHGASWSGKWFERRLAVRQLQPVCVISYLRMARICRTGNALVRLTLDQDLQAHAARDPRAFAKSAPAIAVNPDLRILELKFTGSLPALFKQLLERFALNRTSVSKYRTAATALQLSA